MARRRARTPDTILLAAARRGNVEDIVSAAADGANLNVSSEEGWPVLTVAAQHGHTGAVEALIRLGSDVDARADDGSTALMHAAMHAVHSGDVGTLRILLGATSNINATTTVDATVLDIVQLMQNSPQKDRVVQLLRNAGVVRNRQALRKDPARPVESSRGVRSDS